jgi:putative transposase
MTKYRKCRIKATSKSETISLQIDLPITELLNIRHDIEQFCIYIGLKVMRAFMEHEAQQKTGFWGRQTVYRHGTQRGYVVYDGRKLPLDRPRLRNQQKQEVALDSYGAFQSRPRLEQAVERKLIRNCSTRQYEGALQELAQSYGMKKSSISRHFKACSARELQQLLERPVPAELVALVIDGQHFARNCVTVGMGIDRKGNKHVLGLWHGATENATVATGLLEDLQGRGLNPTQRILVVIDGSKALRKAIQTVLGDRAVVQRCRVHKQRNVVEHLPKEKQGQAIWRLRAAWEKKEAEEAVKELRKTVQWLQRISPTAARSLEEGMEETVTLQKLHINQTLARSFSSTNMIESCFAQVETITARVKHWRDGAMVVRWAAAALLFAERRFRRINGVEQLGALVESLQTVRKEPMSKAA